MHSTKSYTFRVGIYHVGGGKEGGKGFSSTPPVLALGRKMLSCAGDAQTAVIKARGKAALIC